MKHKLFIILLFQTICLGALYADAIKIGGMYYNLDDYEKTAEVASNPDNYSGDVTIPAWVVYDKALYVVTGIGSQAFYNCSDLTSIEIPNSISIIGSSAFTYCNSLTTVTIPYSVTKIENGAFSGCQNLSSILVDSNNEFYTSIDGLLYDNEVLSLITCPAGKDGDVVIPNTISTIEEGAFYECQSLRTVAVGENVATIGYPGFTGCLNLTAINIDANNANYSSIDGVLFDKNQTTLIRYPQGKNDLSYDIPEGVVTLSERAFYSCTRLTTVKIANSVTSIGEGCFGGCWSLKNVTIGLNVKEIGVWAFCNNTYLNSIEIPNSVINIKEDAFKWCGSMKYINVASDNPYYCSVDGILFNKDTTKLIQCPGGKSDTTYIIPNSVKTVGKSAFSSCDSIKRVIIPANVSVVEWFAFDGCDKLESIDIYNETARFEYRTFGWCTNLKYVRNFASTPQTDINTGTFEGVNLSNVTLYVPKKSVNLYKDAELWNQFGMIEKLPPIIFYIKFTDWDGTILSSAEIEEGETATPPANPTREGYTFTGWDKDFSNITENLVVTAQYKINRYYVQFLDWDNSVLKADSVDWNMAAEAPVNPSRDWYTFIGWDKDFSNVTSNLIITAQYQEGQTKDYTLLFTQSTDDSEITSKNISIEMPVPPTISGFTFKKWIVVGGDLDDIIEIQAVYQANVPTAAPEVYTNPANPAQKLIREGNVYILHDNNTYTIHGQKVK